MKCRKCKKPHSLKDLIFKRYGTVKDTKVRQYAALCGKCRKEIDETNK